MKNRKSMQILDCTIRDGGYINNWHFDTKMVREVYRALSKSGVDFVELGFRGTERYFDPSVYGAFRFTSEKILQEIVTGIEGPRISIMGDYGKIQLEDLEDQKNSIAHMVRIAVHKNMVFEAIELLEKIKAKGYIASLQAMGFTGYSDKEKVQLKHAVKGSGLDYFYIADSYGSIFPDEMESLFGQFLELDTIKLGFHPHNSLQMAFANSLEAIRIGVDIIDSSIYGMGRGSGNLPTEVLIAYLAIKGNHKYNVLPVLNAVDRYFVSIMNETPWGYQLPYMISGMFKCHPYYASELVKRKEYPIEDVWKALEIIEEMRPTGFDLKIVENLINKGILGGSGSKNRLIQDKDRDTERGQKGAVPYLDRHSGRDFLVLANGPTLKEYRGKIQQFMEKHDPVVLGANNLSGLFEPDYHAFNNEKRFTMYVDRVAPGSKLLLGENLSPETIREYVNRDYEKLIFDNVLDNVFDILAGRIQTNCRTISVLLLGVSIVMGAKRIFAVGMDGYLGKDSVLKGLFYDEHMEPEEYQLIVERHQWNERFLFQIDQHVREKGIEGIHIITPTSHQRFYKGIENYL